MVCYVVPATAAVIVYGFRKVNTEWKEKADYHWLNLLLSGASIFGVVDHLWNGELFLIGKNLMADLALGLTITLTIFAAWGAIVAMDRMKAASASPA